MNQLRNLSFLAILTVAASQPALAQCDKTFNPSLKHCGFNGIPCTTNGDCSAQPVTVCTYVGNWTTSGDWSGGVPGSTDTACIPAGKTVWLWYSGTVQVGRVIVSTDGTNGDGEIYIGNSSNLQLNGTGSSTTSTVDGEIELASVSAKLVLSANHTISGSGEISGDNNAALIDNSNATIRTLTISSGVTLAGHLEAKVKIVNDGTVSAESGTLKLTNGGYGSGVWQAETASGILLVADQVSGAGTWKLQDHPGAKIVIDAACPCLYGNVLINAGTLDVNQKFSTEGQLSLSGSGTLIDVAAGKLARFSAPNDGPGCLE